MYLGGITESSDIRKLYSFESFIFLAVGREFGLYDFPLSEETFPVARVKARASPRHAEPPESGTDVSPATGGRSRMAAPKIPRGAFGSAHRRRTRRWQPRCPRWLPLVVSGDPRRRIAAFASVCKITSELRVGGKDSNASTRTRQF